MAETVVDFRKLDVLSSDMNKFGAGARLCEDLQEAFNGDPIRSEGHEDYHGFTVHSTAVCKLSSFDSFGLRVSKVNSTMTLRDEIYIEVSTGRVEAPT
jgi:hypothetical protein